MYGLPGRPGAVVPHNRARRCTIRCSLPSEQNCRCRAMCRQPANPLLSGKHGRPRRVADRAASRGAAERCGAALRGHARDSFVRTGEPHSGRRAATLRRASGAKARSAEPANGFSRVRSGIHCFEVQIDGPVQPAPEVNRR